jgi:colicin V production protein
VNTIDLIVYLVLVLAIWNGWRQGFILQICSLAGIVAGIWIAARCGAVVGQWLNLDESISAAGGFVVVLVVVLLLVALAGRVLRKVFHFAGLGVFDYVLGVVVSVFKYLLIMSVIFSAFDSLNEDYTLVGPDKIQKSRTYEPIIRLSEKIFPFLEWVGEQVPLDDYIDKD